MPLILSKALNPKGSAEQRKGQILLIQEAKRQNQDRSQAGQGPSYNNSNKNKEAE